MDEARLELQEVSRAGDAGQGRYCWRDRRLELGAREERLEELLWSEKGKRLKRKKKYGILTTRNIFRLSLDTRTFTKGR